MPITSVVTGRAFETLEQYSLVKVKYDQSTRTDDIPLIDKVALIVPVLGIVDRAYQAGDICSILPVNTDGYNIVRYTFINGLSIGDSVYLTPYGTVSDTPIGGGVNVGVSLDSADSSTPFIRVSAASAGSSVGLAQSVSIQDAGGYYAGITTNVEGALTSIGNSTTRTPYLAVPAYRFIINDSISTLPATLPTIANNAGRPALNLFPGVSTANHAINGPPQGIALSTAAAQYTLFMQTRIPPVCKIGETLGLTVKAIYAWNVATSATFTTSAGRLWFADGTQEVTPTAQFVGQGGFAMDSFDLLSTTWVPAIDQDYCQLAIPIDLNSMPVVSDPLKIFTITFVFEIKQF